MDSHTGGMNLWHRAEMAARRFAHRRGWLWSPSQAWMGVPFGRHGVRLLPVNKSHAAAVLRGHERFNAAMTAFLSDSDERERERP